MARSLARMPSLVAETREERIHDLGVDCPSCLEWKHWKARGEYRKTITLRNIGQKHQKIKYVPPSSGVFSMDYPEDLKLSPGMIASLVVIFKPGPNSSYSDKVVFSTAKGAFAVRLEAKPLESNGRLEVPSQLDFGFCPVKEITRQAFVVRNNGHVPLSFSWESAAPFTIAPPRGSLQPGETSECTAEFGPEEASSFTAIATCTTSAGATSALTLVGVGKYPFLAASSTAVDFGEVLSGTAVSQEIILTNAALVAAAFEVRNVNEGEDERCMRVTPARGRLRPNERLALRVTYAPTSAGTSTSSTFEIPTATGRAIRIECSGSAVGPRVTLSASGISFGMVRAGTDAVRSVRMDNLTGVEVAYQVRGAESGPFSVDATAGTCPAFGSTHITVRFDPKEPLMFHTRLFALMRDHAPLVVNLVGSCFNDKLRPPLLSLKSVTKAGLRTGSSVPEGLAHLSDSFLNGGAAQAESNGTADLELNHEGVAKLAADSIDRDQEGAVNLEGWEEFFSEEEEQRRRSGHVTADVTRLDFGACARGKPSEYKPVTLTNNTEERITCTWLTPEERVTSANPGGLEGVKLYQVIPQEAEIRPGGSFIFNVVFRPKRDDAFYCDDLEALVVSKRLRQWDAALEDVSPPPSIKLRTLGHTFKPGADVMPKADFSSETVALPPAHVGDPAYQTSVIYNRGDTPLKFEIRLTSLNCPFKVHPTEGVIAGRGFQVIGYRFCSESEGFKSERVLCFLNNSPTNPAELHLTASAHLPRVLLTENGNLAFRPTCVGSVSERSFAVRNLVKIPVRVSWAVPEKWSGVVTVHPVDGVLKGGETREFAWSFAPRETGVTRCKVSCLVSGVGTRSVGSPGGVSSKPGAKVFPLDEDTLSEAVSLRASAEGPMTSAAQKLTLNLVGEGASGAVSLTPEELDLGALLVGSTHGAALTLHNLSDGQLRYVLESRSEDLHRDTCLKIEKPRGVIPARSSLSVPVIVRPVSRAELSFEVTCRTIAEESSARADLSPGSPGAFPSEGQHDVGGASGTETERQPDDSWQASGDIATCLITARADCPMIAIVDARSDGVSKDELWRQLRVSSLNEVLAREPGDLERRLNNGRKSADWTGLEEGLERNEVDLGAAVARGKAVRVHLEVKNTGLLTSKWSLYLWGEESVPLESWVQKEKPTTSEDKHRAQIVEEKLFEVRPRGGSLSPGESCHVSIEYAPGTPGVHRLPALLEISRGRSTLLDLVGRTLEPHKKHLVVSENPFRLGGVLLGDRRPPLQGMTLRNGGPTEIHYQLDTERLTELTQANYGFEVLTVRNSDGCIPVGESVQLEWRFQPIEEREYEVELPLHVAGGETTWVKISGYGTTNETRLLANESDFSLEPGSSQALPNPVSSKLGLGYSPKQTLSLPNQPVTLSVESVSFEHVPELSVNRRLFTVRNTTDEPVGFSWRPSLAAHSLACGRVKVEPASGKVAPGGECVCKVVLTSGTQPEVFEVTMICDVMREPTRAPLFSPGTLSPGTKRPTVRWDSGKENKKAHPVRKSGDEEVIIDTAKRIGKDTRGRVPVEHQSVQDATTESSRKKTDGNRIGGTITVNRSFAPTHPEDRTEGAVSSVFLTIAGQVHSAERYRSLFGAVGSHFLVQNSSALSTGALLLLQDDREVVQEVLGDILREAFQDVDVRYACEAGPSDEPVYSTDLPVWPSSDRGQAETVTGYASSRADCQKTPAALEGGEGLPTRADSAEMTSADSLCAVSVADGIFSVSDVSCQETSGMETSGMSASVADVTWGDREPLDGSEARTDDVLAVRTWRDVSSGKLPGADSNGLTEFVLEGTLFSILKDVMPHA